MPVKQLEEAAEEAQLPKKSPRGLDWGNEYWNYALSSG